MHLTKYQRARIRAVRRGAVFEDLPAPAAQTVVHIGEHQIVVWIEGEAPVVGLALVSVDGLPFVACCPVSDALRADVASVLGVEAMEIEGIRRYDPG